RNPADFYFAGPPTNQARQCRRNREVRLRYRSPAERPCRRSFSHGLRRSQTDKNPCFIRVNLWREMKFTKIRASDFDLEQTLNSGQVFHWQKVGDGFVGVIGDRALYLGQRGEFLKVRFGGPPKPTREPRVLPGIVERYFALDHPLAEICNSFPKDPVMNAARDFCHGLRIIRQAKWECLATFICSSMKQVAHIRQISLALRKRFGEQRTIGDQLVYTFASPRRLAQASEKELLEWKLGYRAKNRRATARLVSSGHADPEAWS